MTRFLLVIIFALASGARAGCPPDEVDMYCVYGTLLESVRDHLVEEQYAAAEEVAQTMLKIDPADSWARVYLLVALTHQGKQIPKWLAEEPWPNAEEEQVILQRVGDAILKNN